MAAPKISGLKELLAADEGERLEFKEARSNFHFEKLVRYCAALANEGGGRMVLGVTDKKPRVVVGSQAFRNLPRTKQNLLHTLQLRITADEITDPSGRVLVFHVPSRPLGMPIQVQGAYWMRSGDSLVPMTPDQLKRIFDEAGPDFSAETCRGASIDDLATEAIEEFRRRWFLKSGNNALRRLSVDQLLADAELVVDEGVTYAALVLLGTRSSLGKHLAQAEIVFEYRSSEASGPAQDRVEFREGFFCFYPRLLQKINDRNDVQHFRDGLFVRDVPTFNESVMREALLNAVSHRDYRFPGSVFVRQYPRRISIVSPGGLPTGITVDNMLRRQSPRNRRIAEAFAKCGLVERAGQGMNLIVEECIKESKGSPDFSDTDEHQVSLTLAGTVTDPRFLRFLEQIGDARLAAFNTDDFLVIDKVYRGDRVPDELKARAALLTEQGALERMGRGRGVRYILSREFHDFLGEKGTYTRKRGLDRNTNKELLVRHIRNCREKGARLNELLQVLPDLSRGTVQSLLGELKKGGRIRCEGRTRAARWFPMPPP